MDGETSFRSWWVDVGQYRYKMPSELIALIGALKTQIRQEIRTCPASMSPSDARALVDRLQDILDS